MPIILHTRADLTLDNYRAVVWGGERLLLSERTLATVAEVRAAFLRYIEKHPGAVYGVTSGYGYNARKQMAADEAAAFHRRSLAVGAMSFGDPLPAQIVRGILFARLANLIEGHGDTTVRVVSAIA
jgi:histidine ammonia-lyase